MAGTTNENLMDRTKSIPIGSMPKTIQDAIAITRRLGFRFLWVDAVCIIQPTLLDMSDWIRESTRMGSYYEKSVFTIAAAASSDSAQGCLFQRKALRFPQRPCLLPPLTERKILISDRLLRGGLKWRGDRFPLATNQQFRVSDKPNMIDADLNNYTVPAAVLVNAFSVLGAIGMKPTTAYPNLKKGLIKFDRINPCLPSARHVMDESPLFTRGWVLQELLLSTRVVFWTRDTLYWNCCEKFVSEHGYDVSRFGTYVSKWSTDMQLMRRQPCYDRESALIRWTSVVQRFTSMHLSFPQDTLPAISAIAKNIQEIFPDDYLAGHWRKSLVASLVWVSLEKPGVEAENSGHHWHPDNYVAPSWSWDSVSSFRRISFRFQRREFCQSIELLAATTELAGDGLVPADPTGRVSSGNISLRGVIKDI
jgi:hypothetical protein